MTYGEALRHAFKFAPDVLSAYLIFLAPIYQNGVVLRRIREFCSQLNLRGKTPPDEEALIKLVALSRGSAFEMSAFLVSWCSIVATVNDRFPLITGILAVVFAGYGIHLHSAWDSANIDNVGAAQRQQKIAAILLLCAGVAVKFAGVLASDA